MKRLHLSFSARVAIIYGISAGLWILFSDYVVELLFWDINTLGLAQTYKDWFFVAATGFILYVILKNESTPRTQAAASENLGLYEETRRRLEEMEIVSRISVALRAAQDAEEMLPILFSEVLNIMKTDV